MNPTSGQKRWAGLFLATAAGLLVVTLLALAGRGWSSPKMGLICEVEGESVAGLSAGGKVLLRGIEVGSIESMAMDSTNPDRILVHISVDPKAPIYKDAEASLEIYGITGLKYLELSPGTPASGRATEGHILSTKKSLVTSLLKTVDSVAHVTNRVLSNLESLTSPHKQNEIDSILLDLRHTSKGFSAMAEDMRSARIDRRLTNIADGLERTISNVDSTVRSAHPGRAMARIDSAAASISAVSKRADLMLQRSQGDVYRSLEDMRSSMRSLSEFSAILRDNPSAILRSGERPNR